jgi:hypothetical protein
MGASDLNIIPIDANGNAVLVPDFIFDLNLVTTGTISGDLTTSSTAASVLPFPSWQIANFGANASNQAIAGDSANPSGDGIGNLMKYALGMDPNVNSRIGLPVSDIATVSGTTYLTLTYGRNDAATGITFHPEWSSDLSTWSNTGLIEEVLSDDGSIQEVEDFVPAGSSKSMFIHLRVTRP